MDSIRDDYPNGAYVNRAREKIKEIKEIKEREKKEINKNEEKKEWKKIKDSNSIADFEKFVEKFPMSFSAREKIEQIKFPQNNNSNFNNNKIYHVEKIEETKTFYDPHNYQEYVKKLLNFFKHKDIKFSIKKGIQIPFYLQLLLDLLFGLIILVIILAGGLYAIYLLITVLKFLA